MEDNSGEPVVEATVETTAVTTPVVETPETPNESDALQKQLSELTEKLATTEKSMKGYQRIATEKTREAKEYRETSGASNSRFDAIEEVLKDLANRKDDDDGDGKSNLDTRLTEIKNRGVQEQFNTLAQEAESLAKDLGYDIRDAPELDTVRDYFSVGDLKLAKKGVAKLERMKEKKAEEESKVTEPTVNEAKVEAPKPDDIKKLIDEGVASGIKAYLTEKNLLTPEGGTPSGNASDESFWKEWGEGKIDSTPANLKKAMEIQNNRR